MTLGPAGVIRNTNNASTFQPYDPAATIGDTSPTAAAAPPKKKGCGAIGQIILAAITLAVSVVLDSVLPGSGGILRGAFIGATSSVVSQTIGVATGIQEKFSWKAVALAAIGGGVGGSGFGAGAAKLLPSGAPGWLQAGASAAANNALEQGIGLATGLQDKFDWAGVAASGVGGAAGHWAGTKLKGAAIYDSNGKLLKGSTMGYKLGTSGASLLANAATRSLINGSDFGDNVIAALPSAIGGVIGQSIGESVNIAMTEAARIQATQAPPPSVANRVSAEGAVAAFRPLDLVGAPTIDIPAYEPVRFDPISLAINGFGDGTAPRSLGQLNARLNAYNELIDGPDLVMDKSSFLLGAVGTQVLEPTRSSQYTFQFGATAQRGTGAMDFYSIGEAGSDTAFVRYLSTPDGIAQWDGLTALSFGNLGIRASLAPNVARAATDTARRTSVGSPEPTTRQLQDALAADKRKSSDESARYALKELWTNSGIGGTIEGVKTFAANPTALNAGMIVLGAVPGGKMLGKSGKLWSSTKGKSSVENAFGHWKNHRSEFPELQNAKQYVEATQNFLANPPAGTLSKLRSNGDRLLYSPNTNTFVSQNSNGAPKTMFKPKDGLKYWNEQK